MKKLAVSIIAAFTICLAAAVAQTATDPNQAAPGSSPSANQPGTPSQPQAMPQQQQASPSQTEPAAAQAGQTNNSGPAATEKTEKKLRGCIQSQGGQYVLEGKKGKAVVLTGQDLSAHVGHEVSVKGSWESGAGTGVSSGSASTEKPFNVTSVEMISDTCGAKSSKEGNSGNKGAPPVSTPSSSSPSSAGSTTNPPQ